MQRRRNCAITAHRFGLWDNVNEVLSTQFLVRIPIDEGILGRNDQ